MSLNVLLMLKVSQCMQRVQGEKAIEKLEERKEIATGDEEPCPICFCEYSKG